MGKKSSCGDGDVDYLRPPLFSEDVFIQILVCLPVTSLLRFKSVCKSWLELIESSFFMDLHTTTTLNSSSSSKFGAFILQTREHSVDSYGLFDVKLFMLSISSSGSSGDQKKKKKKWMVYKVDDLGFLPFYKDYELEDTLRMVGSCNGIICLHDPEVMEEDRGSNQQHYSNLRDIHLWNPATRQFRILPKSIPIQGKQFYNGNIFDDFIAFGFDVKTKDYKVLRISRWDHRKESEEGGCMCRVQVYSLSTDSWRLLEGINSLPIVPNQGILFPNHGIYLNGSYFFVATKFQLGNNDSMMLSFDFTKEIFTTIQLPDECSTHIFELALSYLGKKLVVYTTPQIDDIWVLNEQHCRGGSRVNKESWNRLHTSTLTVDGSWSNLKLFKLVNKEIIYLAGGEKNNFLIGTRECRANVYKESLVSIMASGNDLLRWQLPTHGTCYRLNLDAPFIVSYFSFGIGLCLTSDTGGCIGVRSLRRRVIDAKEGEALAMLEAIKWAKKLELSPIIIESDSKNCLSFFMDDDDDDNNLTYWSSGALSLLREAKIILLNSSGISFQYCSRSCNYVADIASKLGRETLGFWAGKDWTANFPWKMVRSLSKDLGSETKERGD